MGNVTKDDIELDGLELLENEAEDIFNIGKLTITEEEEEYVEHDQTQAYKTAQGNGFIPHLADDYTLQLDLDSTRDLNIWQRQSRGTIYGQPYGNLPEALKPFGLIVESIEEWESKSGNTHIQIHLRDPLPARERIAYQFAFGSDPKRETCNLLNLQRGDSKYAIMLFRPAQSKIKEYTVDPYGFVSAAHR